MKRVGYMGPKGTFGEEAASIYIRGLEEEYIGADYYNIQEMLNLISDNELEEAILPIENSIEGAVNMTLDMLSSDNNIIIKAELAVKVNQQLMVSNGGDIEDISYVISHPNPIGQCTKFINKNMPNASIKYVYSTAQAAEEVADKKDKKYAAIGSLKAAECYGLNVLKSNIQDEDNNTTRFVVVSKEKAKRTGNDKTSIVFSTEDEPGSLYRILDFFNLWDINMTKIESRPQKNELGKYIFFVDILGHIDDQDVKDAITMIVRKTSFFKFLGSFPINKY